ncbi:hypothetical protein J6590_040435, partial [Homalodisca vitripennis]
TNLLARPPRLGTCHGTHASSSGSSTDPDMTPLRKTRLPTFLLTSKRSLRALDI